MLPAILPQILHGALPAFEPDCACPTASSPRPPVTSEGVFVRVPELHTQALDDEWHLFCNTLAGGAPVVLNRAAAARLAAFASSMALASTLDRELAASHLVAPPATRYTAPAEPPEMLTAWLHVTNACNLECPYCYIRKSSARMTLATGIKAIDALIETARRRGFRTIKLKMAGGEAALHYRMVQQLYDYAQAAAAPLDIGVRAVVLSNGTIMPEPFAAWLAVNQVRLMLSVDGVEAGHDAQRPWKGGGNGAFAALERNLHERLLPRGVRPDICITITGRTANSAREAVGWAIDHKLPFTLNFYRENEQSARYRDLHFEEAAIIAGLREAYALIEQRLPSWPFLDGLLDRVQASAHSHVCGVGQSYTVITHEGHVAQCQMDLAAARPFASSDDLLELVAGGPLHNLPVDEKEGCRGCAWRYRCAGGCPIVTLRATGRTDVKSPNCAIYQTLLPAALRLEGLRILKVHGYMS